MRSLRSPQKYTLGASKPVMETPHNDGGRGQLGQRGSGLCWVREQEGASDD